jgi:L-seryl-tRNA(Ser) seleniumtransferase
VTAADRQGRAALPAVDLILRSADGGTLIAQYGRALVLDAVRAVLAERRESGEGAPVAAIVADCANRLTELMQPSQRRVFNLTGTVLHTNLGRAPLPEAAIAAAVTAIRRHWNTTPGPGGAASATTMSRAGSSG